MRDLIIIGGGPAGLAAAVAAKKAGVEDILILERNPNLGGILQQCIHNGFGLHIFKEELTGPEYAQRFVQMVEEQGIAYETHSMVLNLTPEKEVVALSPEKGLQHEQAKSIILAMGCRERPRGALSIPGTRPAGIFSAGTAQKFVNIQGKMPGKRVLIVGSGDIGLIMARRMVFEGAKVEAVVELLPYSSGLKRNIVQCLKDYDIPLLLSHTVVEIHGKERVEGATIAQVDERLQPIESTKQYIPCDTIFFSVGLLPENELSKKAGVALGITGGPIVDETMRTNVPGIFACGNVLHVHDLVDYVTEESMLAGQKAADYLKSLKLEDARAQTEPELVPIICQRGVRYTVPAAIHRGTQEPVEIKFRVDQVYKMGSFHLDIDGKSVLVKKFKVSAPGEMEKLVLSPKQLEALEQAQKITLGIEGGNC